MDVQKATHILARMCDYAHGTVPAPAAYSSIAAPQAGLMLTSKHFAMMQQYRDYHRQLIQEETDGAYASSDPRTKGYHGGPSYTP